MKLSRIITWRPSDFPWRAFDPFLACFCPAGFWPACFWSGGLLSATQKFSQGHRSRGLGLLTPWKYVAGVRVCFDSLKCHILSFKTCRITANFTSPRIKDLSKMEDKTNFPRRLSVVKNRDWWVFGKQWRRVLSATVWWLDLTDPDPIF